MKIEPWMIEELTEEEKNSKRFRLILSKITWTLIISGWAWIIKDVYLEIFP